MIDFLESAIKELVKSLDQSEKKHPVVPHIPVNEVSKRVDINLSNEPTTKDELIATLKEIISLTPKTSTSSFYNQLFGGRQQEAVLGDIIATLLNNSMYTYKAAGLMVSIEREIIQRVASLVGYDDKSHGTIASGGSMCNLMACIMARDSKNNKVTADGVNQKMTLYTSSESHYSIAKNSSLIGVGTNQIRKIKTDNEGRLLPSDLKSQIEKDIADGCTPFFINLTAGTTVLGVFDPIPEVCRMAKDYNIWVHVDGAYCGGVLWSQKYRYLVDGVENTDSFSVNAHKMLGTPLTCSILVTKHKNQLYQSFDTKANYLYQTDEMDFNPGKVSLQCGRRNDALKLWTLWKSRGHKGLEEMVNNLFHLAKIAYKYVSNHPDYEVYSAQPSLSVCFNYKQIPAESICTELYEKSKLMIGYGTFRENTFIRLVLVNANNKKEDIIGLFKIIEKMYK
jgi:sulfinoalanine decarboxylase/sulfinoalanine decarboxylase/aspartate 1-decarboxylase